MQVCGPRGACGDWSLANDIFKLIPLTDNCWTEIIEQATRQYQNNGGSVD